MHTLSGPAAENLGDYYWCIDAIGLSHEGAESLVREAQNIEGVNLATALNPREWYVSYYPRELAEALLRILKIAEDFPEITDQDRDVARNVSSDLDEWIRALKAEEGLRPN